MANQQDWDIFKDANKFPFMKINIESLESLSKTKQKAVAMIVDELQKIDNIDEYKQYAQKYKLDFIKDGKFEINNAKDIDTFSDILFRKIYTTEAGTKEVRKANSFKKLN
ncbi:hypothetical protein CCY99_02245 [Helicobacter sp. 16-1353]|nr:hypothetical protein CCY99_02245 [Helicobacter sp. 16-1353]